MPAARQPAPSALVELSTAARIVDRELVRRSPEARHRLRTAVSRVLHEACAGHLLSTVPSRDEAVAHFKAAKRLAIEVGVNPVDLVVAFNGDEDRS